MLPNHAPLVIAEQFGTLAALFPGRIDLGLGRAPGTDRLTARALRRDLATASRHVPPGRPRAAGATSSPRSRASGSVRCPGRGWRCRSGCSARASTARSSPPCSACPSRSPRTSHPTCCSRRSQIYRARFQPSAAARAPLRDARASTCSRRRRTRRPGASSRPSSRPSSPSDAASRVRCRRRSTRWRGAGRPRRGPWPSTPSPTRWWARRRRCGSGIAEFVDRERPDEIMATAMIFDHAARLRSFELLAEIAAGALSR